jgi:ABC-type nitrate/sulfonate/bicarbonate transport system permease component
MIGFLLGVFVGIVLALLLVSLGWTTTRGGKE